MQVHSIKLIIETLNSAGIKYMIVGGLAVNAYGYMRATNDIDLVVALEKENILVALQQLSGIGFIPRLPVTPEQVADAELRDMWIREKNMVVLQLWSDEHARTPLDIFIDVPFIFSDEVSRSVEMEIYPGVFAPFVSLKTLLNMKQSAHRDIDLVDIQRLQQLHPDV